MDKPDCMFVDDEIESHRPLIELLQTMGKNVLEATDGQMGLNLFKKYQPLIVVTDTHMPKLGGPELVKLIQRINRDTRIIACSGFKKSKKEYPPDIDFLTKPYSLKEALKIILPNPD